MLPSRESRRGRYRLEGYASSVDRPDFIRDSVAFDAPHNNVTRISCTRHKPNDFNDKLWHALGECQFSCFYWIFWVEVTNENCRKYSEVTKGH